MALAVPLRGRSRSSAVAQVEGWHFGDYQADTNMKQPNDQELTLELRHIGERLTLRHIKIDNGVEGLRLTGSLPAHRRGPPLHIHFEEDEHVEVVSGTLSASVDGNSLVQWSGFTRTP